jgi:hypothetical protein
MAKKKDEQYSEAEAAARFEQALKGAAKTAPKKKGKPPAPKRERPTDHKGGKSGGK